MSNESTKKTKIYALAGIFGGIAFGGAFLLGSGLTIALGIPIASASVNGFWVGMVIASAVYILREYRYIATSIMVIYGTAATFTVLLGPPGAHKILIGVIMGLLWDFSYKFIPRLLGQLIGAALFIIVSFPMIILAMHLQGSPAIDKLIAATPLLMPVSIVSCVLGAIVGHNIIGQRLDNLPVVKRLLGK